MPKLRWGMLPASSIGRVVATAMRTCEHAELVAVASRDEAKARRYADDLGIAHGFGAYDELLTSDHVDAVYLSLPVSMHAEWSVRALEAGKHVLCEKPLTTVPADAARCFDAAASAGKVFAEGLMYRHHPKTTLARRLVADGAIGALSLVRAALTVSVPPSDIRRSVQLGGGAVGDLGTYCVSAIRLFAGEPESVYATQVLDGEGGVDLRLAATLRMPGGVLGQFDVGLDLPRRDELELLGTEGKLTVPDPWICQADHVELERDGKTEQIPVDPSGDYRLSDPEHDTYRIELDALSEAILAGRELPFGRADAVAQATTLDAVLRAAETGTPVDLPVGRAHGEAP